MQAWALIILLLSDRAIAVRTNSDILDLLGGGTAASSGHARSPKESEVAIARSSSGLAPKSAPQQLPAVQQTDMSVPEAFKNLKKDVKAGLIAEQRLKCRDLPSKMERAIQEAHDILDTHCNLEEERCSAEVTERQADELSALQLRLNALAAAADHKKCLADVMASAAVQANLYKVLMYLEVVLESNGRAPASTRLFTAFRQLRAWQEGSLQLSDALFDQSLMLNHVFRGECPSPCTSCERNNGFGFRCFTSGRENRDITPTLNTSSGVQSFTCTSSRKRVIASMMAWDNVHYKDCEVQDWREFAIQQVHLSAMLHCGMGTILAGLMKDMSAEHRGVLHDACVRREQGNPVAELGYKALTEWTADAAVPEFNKLAFGIFTSLALATGMAALRVSSKGHRLGTSLLEGTASLLPEDLIAVFARGQPPDDVDRELYSKRALVDRDQVLENLEECEDVYDGKSTRLYLQATRAIPGFVMSVKKQSGFGDAPIVVGKILQFPFSVAFMFGMIGAALPFQLLVPAVGFAFVVVILPTATTSGLTSWLARASAGHSFAIRRDRSRRRQFEKCWEKELPATSALVER